MYKVGITGGIGSGKSTVGNCINGLIPFAYWESPSTTPTPRPEG